MKTLAYGVLVAAVLLVTPVCAAAKTYTLPPYQPVTAQRLKNPSPNNWLMTRGNYKGWSFSTLNQINTKNVSKLQPVWSASTGMAGGHEAPAIVNGRYMFVVTPEDQVLAFDAKTGRFLWRFKRELPRASVPCT